MVGLPDFGYEEDGSGDVSGKFVQQKPKASQFTDMIIKVEAMAVALLCQLPYTPLPSAIRRMMRMIIKLLDSLPGLGTRGLSGNLPSTVLLVSSVSS